jgi:hypothetical protein
MDPFNKSASMVGSAGLSWIWKAIQFSVGERLVIELDSYQNDILTQQISLEAG